MSERSGLGVGLGAARWQRSGAHWGARATSLGGLNTEVTVLGCDSLEE